MVETVPEIRGFEIQVYSKHGKVCFEPNQYFCRLGKLKHIKVTRVFYFIKISWQKIYFDFAASNALNLELKINNR